MNYTIALLPGDGIGPEVLAGAVTVLDRVGERFGHSFDIRAERIGGNAIDTVGTPLPDETLATCAESDAVMLGAVGGPKWDDLNATVRPEDGLLGLRKSLGLFANVRPVKVHDALTGSSPVRAELLEGVDMVVLRELTGGLYFGRPKKRWNTSRGRRGVDTLKYTEAEVTRIVTVAFEMARGRRNKVTSVDKANVLETSRLWREVTTEVAEGYPDVELEHILVDAAAMELIRNPAGLDVMVTENMFGDILTDEASVLSGSMGMLPSASLAGVPGATHSGPKTVDMYEPIHGSAPDIAGQGIANPIGAILSSALLLRYSLGLDDEADAVERAVDGALAEGYRTPDIGRDGGPVVGTEKMIEAITGGI